MADQCDDSRFMAFAMQLASQAATLNEVPVGAVVVLDNEIIGTGYNRTLLDTDPTAHAEVVALRAAAKQRNNHRLPGSVLYCTLEPCCLCAGAIIQARVNRVVFGCHDPKTGAVDSLYQLLNDTRMNHQCSVHAGVMASQSSALLREFFAQRRR